MVETEGNVEGGIAVPGAFGIEQDRPGRAGKDVLRADIAMDEGNAAAERLARQIVQLRGNLRMTQRRSAEIGLEADAAENVVRRKFPRHCRIVRRCRMDRGEDAADLRREAGIDMAGQQLFLPVAVLRRVEMLHDEKA